MALGIEVADGNRKLTVEARTISGAAIDLTSLAILPLLQPYTLFATLRLTAAPGAVTELDLKWQAIPRLPETTGLGPVIGAGTPPVSPTR